MDRATLQALTDSGLSDSAIRRLYNLHHDALRRLRAEYGIPHNNATNAPSLQAMAREIGKLKTQEPAMAFAGVRFEDDPRAERDRRFGRLPHRPHPSTQGGSFAQLVGP